MRFGSPPAAAAISHVNTARRVIWPVWAWFLARPLRATPFVWPPGSSRTATDDMSADDVSISEAEARLREHVLESFFARDPRGSRRVSTSQFQGVLQEHGLRLGDEAVDRIMLECTIDTATSTVRGVRRVP